MGRLAAQLFIAFATGLCMLQATVAAERTLDPLTLRSLGALAPAKRLAIDSFPVGPTRLAAVQFERVPIYASDAHVYSESASGRREIPRSQQIFLRGYSADGSVRVALALNADFSIAHGNGSGPEGAFALHPTAQANGASALVATKLEADLPAGFNFEYRCGNENDHLDLAALDSITTQLQAAVGAQAAATATTSVLKQAIVALDTDSLFMSRLFANNTTNAANWIAAMFNTMNVMYERDLNVRLLVGTTILRTTSANDPYTGFSTTAGNAELNAFSSYWKANESAVKRSFAVLLSGAIAPANGGCSASGIAWINQYCQNGFGNGANTVGSYSVTEVCTSLAIDPNATFDARIVGHELGHNFGAYHTHCTNKSTGAAPTATNTIDTCYNGESGGSCYAGATSCPAAGSGTIMSYCNYNSSGCAAGTQNQLQFHATHIAVIAAEPGYTGVCLATSANDTIFTGGFQ